ncbi:23S rRNA (uracil(747)-C(5))-methyltransferase RlmC [Necropsobacter massiliensis]|uniref:23S rRNA (uracil(747)-C(5))-methyltransferase RlmC n=1 Tax=Necropsobacter massiliensis TaxID=1400001 RepID=UPI000596202F|nr:23S rRNA (uracil(747)-C(5))-methyltransferase RlmC [Necropsobacter massiliensis]
MPLTIPCRHYRQQDCRSCQWLEKPYAQQLADKTVHLQQQLATLDQSALIWHTPYSSPLSRFRNKAKMVVSGTVERPVLGILPDPTHPHSAVDLCDCPLYPAAFDAVFPVLKDFIARAGLVPYNTAKQKGELKYILLSESKSNGDLMLRFVLRSQGKLPLIRRELPALQTKLPQLTVISVNIQSQHAAILEGETEIFLTEKQNLPECFNHIPLFMRPQGFFQTNPSVAQGLYGSAQQWVKDLPIRSIWDLFCGAGGFGLHCAHILQRQGKEVELVGIEIAPSAIFAAGLSARQLNLKNVSFQSLDAAQFALAQKQTPDLLIVNPPRRGLGTQLAQFLNQLQPHFILYSSCNAVSMAKDLAHLQAYRMQKIQLFDMFPHTAHYEVLTLLTRK